MNKTIGIQCNAMRQKQIVSSGNTKQLEYNTIVSATSVHEQVDTTNNKWRSEQLEWHEVDKTIGIQYKHSWGLRNRCNIRLHTRGRLR